MTDTTTRRKRGHRARKGEGGLLREEILDAAERLLSRHGSIDAVSVRAIARAVGVTPPALYLHFEDKDQLFYAVCRRGFDGFAARLGPVLSSEGSAFERIKRLGEEYVRFGLDNAEQYPILFGIKTNVDVPESELADDPGLRILNGLVALVEEAQADGEIPADRSPRAVATVLWAAAHGTVSLLIGSTTNPDLVQIPPAEEVTPIMIEFLTRGMAASGK